MSTTYEGIERVTILRSWPRMFGSVYEIRRANGKIELRSGPHNNDMSPFEGDVTVRLATLTRDVGDPPRSITVLFMETR
jgi:hypothetical protein